jgi:CRP-like cAMP-binding protein/RsiW-degrading membrane proteinase PrsW (M82 family)
VVSIFITILSSLIPVAVVYFFYKHYFHIKPSIASQMEYFTYGILLASLIILLGSVMAKIGAYADASPMVRGFVTAAFIERTGAFIFIYILMHTIMRGFMVLNAVISSMLVGIGFAAVENVLYSHSVHNSVIMVRLISSVPMHVLCCGLTGYFLSLKLLHGSRLNKAFFLLLSYALPLLFHGCYDVSLFYGGLNTYIIAPLLIMLILSVEYCISKSQSLPLLEDIQNLNISLEDWYAILRQPDYEKWILTESGASRDERVPFLRLQLGLSKSLAVSILFITAAAAFFYSDDVSGALHLSVSYNEAVVLFVILPLLYGINLLAIGLVNPKYFQSSIIRIPIIVDIRADYDNRSISTVAYNMTRHNCFMKTAEPISPGTRMTLNCGVAGRHTVPIEAVSLWNSHGHGEKYTGTLVRFRGLAYGHVVFLVKYNLMRMLHGLSYNLHLPGFKDIRHFFVRPVSVMQRDLQLAGGTEVFRQGDHGATFFLVKKGSVSIMKELNSGERVHLTTVSEGSVFGEMAIAGDQPRLATAVCAEDCVLAVAEADNLDVLIKNDPIFANRIIHNFARRLYSSEQTMLESIGNIERTRSSRENSIMALCRLLIAVCGHKTDDGVYALAIDASDALKKLGLNENAIRGLARLINCGDDSEIMINDEEIERLIRLKVDLTVQ